MKSLISLQVFPSKCVREQFFKILHEVSISVDACSWDFPFPELWEDPRPAPKADYVPGSILRAKGAVVNQMGSIPVLKESTV